MGLVSQNEVTHYHWKRRHCGSELFLTMHLTWDWDRRTASNSRSVVDRDSSQRWTALSTEGMIEFVLWSPILRVCNEMWWSSSSIVSDSLNVLFAMVIGQDLQKDRLISRRRRQVQPPWRTSVVSNPAVWFYTIGQKTLDVHDSWFSATFIY